MPRCLHAECGSKWVCTSKSYLCYSLALNWIRINLGFACWFFPQIALAFVTYQNISIVPFHTWVSTILLDLNFQIFIPACRLVLNWTHELYNPGTESLLVLHQLSYLNVDLVRVRKRMRFQPQVQVVYLVRMLFSCVRIFKTITNTTTLDCITTSDTARQLISYVQRVQKPIFSTFYRFFANKIIFINKILSCLFLLCIVYQLYVSICHFKALLKNKQMPCAQLIWLILGKETGNKSASIKTYFDES